MKEREYSAGRVLSVSAIVIAIVSIIIGFFQYISDFIRLCWITIPMHDCDKKKFSIH